MAAQLTELEVARAFFLSEARTGFTLVSSRTGVRFTYEVAARSGSGSGDATRAWFVDVLTGPDNESDFAPLGVVTAREDGLMSFRPLRAGGIGRDAPSFRAFGWMFEQVVVRGNAQALELVTMLHEGRCGRCGRRLTTPSSILRGLGPDCAERL